MNNSIYQLNNIFTLDNIFTLNFITQDFFFKIADLTIKLEISGIKDTLTNWVPLLFCFLTFFSM